MSTAPATKRESAHAAGAFQTTLWSVVLTAGDTKAPNADAALESLCATYWHPLYVYVRRNGHSPEDAQDLTQSFFARLLEKSYLKLVSQDRGRFRAFLLKSLQHFLVNDWARGRALKRGGGALPLSLDVEAGEREFLQDCTSASPEHIYDKRWALTLLDRAMQTLGRNYAALGKGDLFECLKPLLLDEGSADIYGRIAITLGMNEAAVKVALHRLRRRFREVVRAEIAQTVATPAEIDEELRALISALSA